MSAKRKPMPALDAAAFADAAVPQPDPVHVATRGEGKGRRTPAKSPQASRAGKVQVQVWVAEETRRRLKLLAVSSDRTVEELLAGAINDLIRKR